MISEVNTEPVSEPGFQGRQERATLLTQVKEKSCPQEPPGLTSLVFKGQRLGMALSVETEPCL